MIEELELKHVLPYLPYELKAQSPDNVISTVDVYMRSYNGERVGLNFLFSEYKNTLYKPLLRPMSDLFEDVVHNGEVICVAKLIASYDDDLYYTEGNKEIYDDSTGKDLEFNGLHFPNGLPYYIVETLFEYHFDVFLLIEKGLAEPITNEKTKA